MCYGMVAELAAHRQDRLHFLRCHPPLYEAYVRQDEEVCPHGKIRMRGGKILHNPQRTVGVERAVGEVAELALLGVVEGEDDGGGSQGRVDAIVEKVA